MYRPHVLSDRKLVLTIYSLEHFIAVESSSKLGAEQEGSRVFSENGVALFWKWSEAVVEDYRNHLVYLCHGILLPKVKDSVVFEWLSENQ